MPPTNFQITIVLFSRKLLNTNILSIRILSKAHSNLFLECEVLKLEIDIQPSKVAKTMPH